MGKEMDKLRGMALANKAKHLAESDARGPPAAKPAIPGVRLPGAAPRGQIRSHVTTVGRARRGLVAAMMKHVSKETLAKLTPGQRVVLEDFKKLDGSGR